MVTDGMQTCRRHVPGMRAASGTVHETTKKDSHAGCPFLSPGLSCLLQAGHGRFHFMAEAGQEILGREFLRMGMQALGIEIPFTSLEAAQGIGQALRGLLGEEQSRRPPRSRWHHRVRKR